jgi:hypothetical protein
MKLRLLLFVLAAVLLLPCVTQAQTEIGARVGLSFSTFREENRPDNSRANPGVEFGVLINKGIVGDILSIQPEIQFTQSGARIQPSDNNFFSTTVNNIRVPVLVKLEFKAGPVGLFFEGGPYAGYAISGQNRFKTTNDDSKSDIDFTRSEFRRFDAGGILGAGVAMGFDPIKFTLGARYAMGLVNLNTADDIRDSDKFYNNSWIIGVGVHLGF